MPFTTTTRVQIFGQVYHLKAQDEPEHIQRVAELVDRKMSFIADHGASTDSYRVAVLAALDIADELVRLREEFEGLKLEREKVRNDQARSREKAGQVDRISALLAKLDSESEQASSDESSLFPARD